MNPLFSIVIPLYNHERFVAETINSVLRQSMQHFELIIIDDGSTDNSAEEVAKFTDARIRYYYQENQGAHIALNNGFSMSRGKFVAVLNSDDVYHPERLQSALDIFDTHEEVGAYFSGYDFIDQSSNLIRPAADIIKFFQPLPSISESNTELLSNSDKWVLLLLSGNLFHTTSNLVLRSEVIDAVGFFKPWRYVHDYDFFLRLCLKTPIFFDERPLLQYRFHGNNTLAENATRSVSETMLVIAEFLIKWRPSSVQAFTQKEISALFQHFYKKLRLYGGGHLLLALVLTELMRLNRNDDVAGTNHLDTITAELLTRQSIDTALADAIQQDTSREIQQLEIDLAWQKDKTNYWWQRSQQLEIDLAWQKDKTDYWWQRSQQLEIDLAWQKNKTEETEQSLAKVNRLCGLPNLLSHCRQRLIRFYK